MGILYKDVFAKDGVLGFAPCFKMAALMMVLGGLWYIFVCWRFLGDLGKLPFKKTLTEEEKAAEAKKKEEAGTKHYDVVDFEVPMTLSLYNYQNNGTYENAFNWVPRMINGESQVLIQNIQNRILI